MAGREVVYTVHKFEAENVDEISINVGEQVVVLEKDEGFNDGWWQGRNIRGEVGLFPISYTVQQPPVTLDNKIDSLENTISKMKVPTPTTTQNKVSENTAKKPVEQWTSEEVAAWLIEVGFDAEVANNFKDQEISGDILLELTLESLKELQITTFGKRFKIHSAINGLKQESSSKKQQKHTSSIETRVTSPIPETKTIHPSNRNTTTTIPTLYHANKQQQPYADDDLVSDYSTVIRNSRLPSNSPAIIPPRPSIPLDMNLIASSPRLSTLVERQNSVSSTHTDRQRRLPTTNESSHPSQRMIQQQQQQQQQRQATNERIIQHQQQQNQQQAQSRPVSHQPASIVNNNNGGSSDWKRNTMNNIKSQEPEDLPRSSTSSRYSFMRHSKLQSILPNTAMGRRSEDVSMMHEATASPEMEGWLYKQGDKYKTWNKRWFVLKTNNLFYFKSPKAIRMKGIINLKGYRIDVDESIQPGKYCFKAQHERERTFYFYTEHEKSMKDWLKALMKATIARDFATPVMSSSTIPTVSLEMARRMRPRPPSTIFHQKDRSPTPSHYRIHNNLDHHFSMMAIDEHPPQPIMPYFNQSRAPSVVSVRQPDNVSEYSTRLKDSGFNSGNLTRSVTDSSNSSTRKSSNRSSIPVQNTSSIATSPNSHIFYPDEEDEDLIDPEHLSVMESNRYPGSEREVLYRHEEEQEDDLFNATMLKKQQRYVDWINLNVQNPNKVKAITDLCTGQALLELLETLGQKEIMRPMTNPQQSVNVQCMDRIIAAFKFMSREGIEIDSILTVRDVLNGDVEKIMFMLDAIKYWSRPNTEDGKKMASGGTFGEEDQNKLRELEEDESILPPAFIN